MRPISRLLIMTAIIAVMPFPAFAYIDPGTVSMVIQGLFAVFFGAATAWVVRPWHFLKSLFRGRKSAPATGEMQADTHGRTSVKTTKK